MSTENVDRYLGYADAALDLIPDLPGTADDIAIASAHVGIAMLRALLKRGRTMPEIIATLALLKERDGATLDVDVTVDDWLSKNVGATDE